MTIRRPVFALALLAFFVALALPAFAADNVLGLWKTISDKTGKAQSLAVLYLSGGRMYGRIIATFEDDGVTVKDTLVLRKTRADALAGDPLTCGLDFVYEMVDKGKDWQGFIMDPEDGSEYACRIWREDGKLIVRGQLKGLGFLGRNQAWLPATSADLPAGLAMPDSKAWTPVRPAKKK